MRPGEQVPEGVVEPANRIRHCQSIAAARRGNCMVIPPRKHACPDGAGIMGLITMSAKLRSGDLYLLFKKLPTIECARKMISSREEFAPGTYTATLVAPLEKAAFAPDVVIFTLLPEQAMWLCCAATYGSGERHVFRTSGYNSTCADLVVQVMKSQKMNISFGCYGARASSDVGDSEVYLSIPYGQLPALIASLEKLAAKSIPEARHRIYMPPVIDSVARPGQESEERVEVLIDADRCNGCGLCAAFCPESVIETETVDGAEKARVIAGEKCCACYTCVGQCPQQAIQLKPARRDA
jgi:uncharacterized protein (DUF169 family)/ferredoxin